MIDDIYDLGFQLADDNKRSLQPNNEMVNASGNSDDDRFDLDVYFILVRFLVDRERIKMNSLKIWPLTESSSLV